MSGSERTVVRRMVDLVILNRKVLPKNLTIATFAIVTELLIKEDWKSGRGQDAQNGHAYRSGRHLPLTVQQAVVEGGAYVRQRLPSSSSSLRTQRALTFLFNLITC